MLTIDCGPLVCGATCEVTNVTEENINPVDEGDVFHCKVGNHLHGITILKTVTDIFIAVRTSDPTSLSNHVP
jgi:hypothetical protein